MDGLGSDLADDDARGQVRQSRRIRKRHLGGDRQCQRRNHRVAGSGHIEYLPRLGRDELRFAVLAHQTHAGRAPGDQQPGKIEPADGSLHGRGQVLVGLKRRPVEYLHLTAVRRDAGGPAVAFPISSFGVHKNRNPSAAAYGYHRLGQAVGLKQPLSIIGQDNRIRFPGIRIHPPDHFFPDIRTDRSDLLLIEADELLAVGNEPGLGDGRPIGAFDAEITDRCMIQKSTQPPSGFVRSAEPNHGNRGAQADEVRHHVAGAPSDL